jgi:hypothetical protein
VTSSRLRLRPNWLIAIRRYLIAIAFGNLLWETETAQMPLYTLWRAGTAAAIAQAVLHCTVGDVLIATLALVAALAVAGSAAWPNENVVSVAVVVVIGAASYTAYSEYVNTSVRKSWAYTEWMPTLPWLGTVLRRWLSGWCARLGAHLGPPRFGIEWGRSQVRMIPKSCWFMGDDKHPPSIGVSELVGGLSDEKAADQPAGNVGAGGGRFVTRSHRLTRLCLITLIIRHKLRATPVRTLDDRVSQDRGHDTRRERPARRL